MKQTVIPLFILLILFLHGCNKEEIKPGETRTEDTILPIVYNPYFPMDTNDQWIYKDTYSRYEPCFIGEELTQCIVNDTYTDTFRFYNDKIIGNHKVRIRNNLANTKLNRYYNTQSDRIILVLDGTYYLDSIQSVTILFTEVKDTSWTVPVAAGNTVYNINFTQKHPENAIEGLLELRIGNGGTIGLLSEYRFLHGKGIISYYGTGGNSALNGYLMEYIDN